MATLQFTAMTNEYMKKKKVSHSQKQVIMLSFYHTSDSANHLFITQILSKTLIHTKKVQSVGFNSWRIIQIQDCKGL